jgi:hypothetical protein
MSEEDERRRIVSAGVLMYSLATPHTL